ncbi:hypothetical protein BVX99_02055 [bacterium F16]|nr:hypothetical protein BVX99_02055 [bacterium F16]
MNIPKLSLLVPTRGRVLRLERFLDSIVDMADNPNTIEVVLAIDSDDTESCSFEYDRLTVKKVIVAPGNKMGYLNQVCYDHSTADTVALMNDDLIAQIKGFDTKILHEAGSYPDGVFLFYINDGIFGEKLCTFPILSRKVCDKIGLCPEIYQRYKIDDHIFSTFNLLAKLGERRIHYLKNLTFEHDNVHEEEGAQEYHTADDGKIYTPDQTIILTDHEHYVDLFEQRKRDAMLLKKMIASYHDMTVRINEKNILESITDLYAFQDPSFITHVTDNSDYGRADVTIAVVSANIQNQHTQECINSIKTHTAGSELIVLDNSGRSDFSHPREMNRAMSICQTRFIVLMDDDVIVSEGWLEGLLKGFRENVGAVTPLHRDRNGNISYAGIYFSGDSSGGHGHTLELPVTTRPTMTHCSACMIIDLHKCGNISLDENYTKYFFDLVHGLQVWESGWQVIVTPDSVVTHLGGVTAGRGSDSDLQKNFRDRELFITTWENSGRLKKLREETWAEIPYLNSMMKLEQCCNTLAGEVENGIGDTLLLHQQLDECIAMCDKYPLMGTTLITRIILLPEVQRAPRLLSTFFDMIENVEKDSFYTLKLDYLLCRFLAEATRNNWSEIVLYGAGQHSNRKVFVPIHKMNLYYSLLMLPQALQVCSCGCRHHRHDEYHPCIY